MTTETFGRALSLVLKHEGGYVDHPKDPGGATNRGITLTTLSAWRGRRVSKAEVKALTVEEAGAIYRANYWNVVKGDDLPAGLDYAVFDFAVLSGPARAAKHLQALVGTKADGVIGPQTLAAVRAGQPADLVRKLTKSRFEFLSSLPTWPVFGKGWRSRIVGVEQQARAMITAPAAPAPVPPPPGSERAPAPPPPGIDPAPVPVSQPATSGGLFAALKGLLEARFGKKA
ncbi:glycoside hydrolase family 108 protein [Microvirga mediterraneensis]|uniref:Glycoside hydrolase family 108 protein n=1 Tax=Microvirga mediterraneensis TaxID=2754695 RepID=A0A838BPS1_9HYPH|nr:glycoside hydrolase family 108 protein [Microvirga mediterraneensis]MBA1157744.1 glycoside hydrolase family 108 protein [Microvirga mediterraneensis]